MPTSRASSPSLFGLDALNFLLADVRDGLGPYLAIYLISVRGSDQGWDEASAGAVMTIAGIVGLIVQTPIGAWVDRSRHKLRLIAGAALAVTASCVLLPFVAGFAIVTGTQAVAAIGAAVFPPALSAVTLGIVGPRAFTARVGRNEAFNHAGNAVSAALAGTLAFAFGANAVFWWMGLLTLLSIGAVFLIPRAAIDDALASGLVSDEPLQNSSGTFLMLFRQQTLRMFALAMALFHLANAAMLTSVGQLLARVSGQRYATMLLSVCIVVAQVVMVPVAVFAGRKADTWGRKPIFLAAFAVLFVRGMLYSVSDAPAWLMAVQCLDGVGAGVFGVLFPVVVADLTRGTSHFNVTQGAVATAQGIGAALSASLAGVIIVAGGYALTFVALAVVALLGFVLYGWAVPETRATDLTASSAS